MNCVGEMLISFDDLRMTVMMVMMMEPEEMMLEVEGSGSEGKC